MRPAGATAAAMAAAAALPPTPVQAQEAPGLLELCLATVLSPGDFWQAWSFSPWAVVPLVCLLGAFIAGHRQRDRRLALFLAGWSVLALALVSPLCRLAATLVSAHMVQLMLITIVAPALIALAQPGGALARALRLGAAMPRGREWTGVTAALYGGLIWLWHVPSVYEAVLIRPWAHVALFALMIVASLAFWSLHLNVAERRASSALTLLATAAHTGLLGAILTFAPRTFYPVAAAGAEAWGLSPLADQQLAGLLMWVGGGFLYLLAVVGLAWRILRDGEADGLEDAGPASPPRGRAA